MKTDATTYTEYHYDYDQRLVQVKDYASSSLQWTATYTYDPLGNLVKKVKGGTTTTYVQDINGGLPVVLIKADGTNTCKYTYGNDRLKMTQNSTDYYFYYDGLGSTRTITNASGVVKARYVYDVYGKKLTSECNEDAALTNQPFLFTGELYDEDTELIYLRARWYDPSTGRFLSRDKVEARDYMYCEDDPVNFADPNGQKGALVNVLISTSIYGALFGMIGGALTGYVNGEGLSAKYIIEGAIAGAILAPLAVAFPTVGITLGVVGIVSSGYLNYKVWTDEESTTGQKIAASLLLVASVFGMKAAWKHNARIKISDRHFMDLLDGIDLQGKPPAAVARILSLMKWQYENYTGRTNVGVILEEVPEGTIKRTGMGSGRFYYSKDRNAIIIELEPRAKNLNVLIHEVGECVMYAKTNAIGGGFWMPDIEEELLGLIKVFSWIMN